MLEDIWKPRSRPSAAASCDVMAQSGFDWCTGEIDWRTRWTSPPLFVNVPSTSANEAAGKITSAASAVSVRNSSCTMSRSSFVKRLFAPFEVRGQEAPGDVEGAHVGARRVEDFERVVGARHQAEVVTADAVVEERQRVQEEAAPLLLAEGRRHAREHRLRLGAQLAAEEDDHVARGLADKLAGPRQFVGLDAELARRGVGVAGRGEREHGRVLRAGADVYELRGLLLEPDRACC